MMRFHRHLSLAIYFAMGALGANPAAAQTSPALALAREVERLARAGPLWPEYDPLIIPLAVYDGTRTFLFRHPAPPPGFTPLADARPAAFVFAGRHPALTSNSSADLGGTMTATVLADGARGQQPPAELAAVALHEAFHVFQRREHPRWSGNEVDLMRYPIADASLLALRRQESAALVRALASPNAEGAMCWAQRALGHRNDRFARLDSAFTNYERLSELNEGVATYVQLRALNRRTVEIPAREFRPADVRLRTYASGPALALLLDRFSPGWQATLQRDDRNNLDAMLQGALRNGSGAGCGFSASERADFERTARSDSAALVLGWTERQRAFDARPGWRVIVQAAGGQPLWPQNFDPLNLERIAGGMLHTRWISLGNDAGQVRVIDEAGVDLESVTEGIGPHPLFNGVRRVVIAGLPKPTVETATARVVVRATGLTLTFTNATVRERGNEIVIELQRR
ncbi:MAG: hypothetical protein ACRENP_12305 [Longimicrobiales bacterium]